MARAYYPATQALLLLQLAWQAESSLPEMLNDCTGQPVADAVNPCQLIGAGIANALQAAKGLEQRLSSFGPMPGTCSSGEAWARFWRRFLCPAMANRWASSRIC